MSIYSDQLQQLTDQLVAQAATLMEAVAAGDINAMSSAANSMAATLNSISGIFASSDPPADNTMILYLTNDLTAQVGTLQQAINGNDNQAISDAANVVNSMTVSYNQCVTRMKEVIVVPDPIDPKPWMGGPSQQSPPSQSAPSANIAKAGKPPP